jgi:hypothetical protein
MEEGVSIDTDNVKLSVDAALEVLREGIEAVGNDFHSEADIQAAKIRQGAAVAFLQFAVIGSNRDVDERSIILKFLEALDPRAIDKAVLENASLGDPGGSKAILDLLKQYVSQG